MSYFSQIKLNLFEKKKSRGLPEIAEVARKNLVLKYNAALKSPSTSRRFADLRSLNRIPSVQRLPPPFWYQAIEYANQSRILQLEEITLSSLYVWGICAVQNGIRLSRSVHPARTCVLKNTGLELSEILCCNYYWGLEFFRLFSDWLFLKFLL